MYDKENPLKFKVINCKNYIYIANEDYYGTKDLTRFRFDGEMPEKTNKDKWFKLMSIPKVVSMKQQDKRINITVRRGDAFMQGIFVEYGITEDDKVETSRNGGFGSTDKNKKE